MYSYWVWEMKTEPDGDEARWIKMEPDANEDGARWRKRWSQMQMKMEPDATESHWIVFVALPSLMVPQGNKLLAIIMDKLKFYIKHCQIAVKQIK